MNEKTKRKVIYKITYPNGKIYVGKDLIYDLNYFGSANGKLIEADFSWEEQQVFCIKKEILWFSDVATNREVHLKEFEFIRKLNSNNPVLGYNRLPKFRA